MQEAQQKYVVSDICDTLFYSNTTFDFIRYCVEQGWLGKAGALQWQRFLKRESPLFWALVVLNKLTRADYHKRAAVGLLKGYEVSTVRRWATSFYQEYLGKRRVEEAFALLRNHSRNTQLILASSSIEPVVAEIAQALGATNYVATRLEEENGVYTGRIAEDLTGKKVEALKSLLQHGAPVAVLSDNTTDRSLMALAERGYAVCYNDVQRKFWSAMPGISLVDVKRKES